MRQRGEGFRMYTEGQLCQCSRRGSQRRPSPSSVFKVLVQLHTTGAIKSSTENIFLTGESEEDNEDKEEAEFQVKKGKASRQFKKMRQAPVLVNMETTAAPAVAAANTR